MKLCRRLATDHPRISDNAPEVFIRDEIIPNGVIGTNIPKTECLFLSTRRSTPLLWAVVERGQGRQRPQEGEGASAVPFTASALFCTTPTFSRLLDLIGCGCVDLVLRLFYQWLVYRENGSQFRSVDENAEFPVTPLPSEAGYPEYSPGQTGHPYLNYSRCKYSCCLFFIKLKLW